MMNTNTNYWDTMTSAWATCAESWEEIAAKPTFADAMSRAAGQMSTLADPSQWTEQFIVGDKVETGRTPFQIAWRSGASSLRCYEPEGGADKAVFIVYAMVNRPYVLDMLPGRSVVEQYLAEGVRVYLLNWGEPTRTEGDLPLDVFIHDILGGALDEALRREKKSSLPVLGYCQGGTLALEYALVNSQKIENLILLATPIDFTKLGLLTTWSKNFQPDHLIDHTGNVPGWKIRAAFEGLRPFHVGLRWNSFLGRMAQGKATGAQKEHFVAMEKWIADPVDMPGRAYSEFCERYYQNNELLGRIKNLKVPVKCVVGLKDNLVPAESTLAIYDHVKGDDPVQCKCGHIGLSVGSRAHKEVWPQVIDWMTTRVKETPAQEKQSEKTSEKKSEKKGKPTTKTQKKKSSGGKKKKGS